ncbi:protein DpdD [Nocardioides sp. SYSU D00065]|uniref:protein DpdD n=1 Tax=Nocardioides sp. SYSU D00065 TaxID=2817378 RepID=UPI001B327EDC|nr:protein DpdD [Nocardioides sp. SYSU D00065]
MRVDEAIGELVGDLGRFGAFTDRVEGLVDAQVKAFRPASNDWIVVPWASGFHLFSDSSEGQRRGREVVFAFLGPAVASLETVPEARLRGELPSNWQATGLTRASYIRRTDQGPPAAERLLSRLEDLVASVVGREAVALHINPTSADLLRDFRLALLARDDVTARQLIDRIALDGRVSAENLRYLRIEYFAAFGRWADMRAMPHIGALLQARRPRAISETLIRMIWWAELAGPEYQSAKAAFAARGVLDEFGPLLRSVRLPSTPEGRAVCSLAAEADSDTDWLQELLDSAGDAEERHRLEGLVAAPEVEGGEIAAVGPDEPPASEAVDPVAAAFRDGRHADVTAHFVEQPSAEHAELALQAVLDSGISTSAPTVLALVGELVDRGELALSRHGRRDFAELQQLVDDACPGWVEWASRLAADTRWSDAGAVARNSADSWAPVASLEAGKVAELCDALLEASDGVNADQLRASTDLLCKETARSLAAGSTNDFCQAVLVLLSAQENFSEMVRLAYLDLFAAWLDVGPTASEYGDILTLTTEIWVRIASPKAITWCVSVLEGLADSPCPDDAKRTASAATIINSARQHVGRLSFRERIEVEGLAADLGLPALDVEPPSEERDVWAALDGKLIGVYSLLPRAAAALESRLRKLCQPREVRGNSDTVATQALRSLAERADELVVDTWHAAHQATGAIDAVRPKDRQVLPRQRGVSGFLRALEEVLEP